MKVVRSDSYSVAVYYPDTESVLKLYRFDVEPSAGLVVRDSDEYGYEIAAKLNELVKCDGKREVEIIRVETCGLSVLYIRHR